MKYTIVTKYIAATLHSRASKRSSRPPGLSSWALTVIVFLSCLGLLIQIQTAEALCVDYEDYIGWETTFRSTFYGVVEDILVEGDYAYLAYSSSSGGGKLCVVDISNPGNPVQVSLITTSDNAFGLDYDDHYLYVICDDGLTIYDATNAAAPVQVGYVAIPGSPVAVAIRWPIGIVVGDNPELSLLNIATPTNPMLTGSIAWYSGEAEDVRVEGNLAYVADNYAGLKIVDFSDYPNLVIRSSVDLPGSGYGIHLRGSYAWVMGQDAVTVFDVSNPDAPTISNSTALPGLAMDVCFLTTGGFPPDTYAAVAMQEGTTLIFDSTDAGVLVPVCSVPGPYGARCIAADVEDSSWHYLFVGSQEQGMYVVNRGNSDNPPVVGTIDVDVLQVVVGASTAYLGTHYDIQIFDVSSAASPQMLGSVSISSAVTDMLLRGPYLFTTQGYLGLHIYDVSSPENPALLGSEQSPQFGGALDVDWPYVYVVSTIPGLDRGLRVYDISDPANPLLIAIESDGWEWDYPARDVVVHGSYAYVTGDDEVFLRVVDISNPADPDLVNYISDWGFAYSVDVADGFAFISKWWGGSNTALAVYDLSNPLQPAEVAEIIVPVFSREAKVVGDYAFLTSDFDWIGMFILDVSNPADPRPLGIAATEARDLYVNSSYMFIANRQSELLIMPTQCGIVTGVEETPAPTSSSLAAYPNPFNPRTTFLYELPAAARVDLAIYDLSGRLVRKLMTGQLHDSGRFEVAWSGSDEFGRPAASGVYLCRLEAGDHRAATRVTLLK